MKDYTEIPSSRLILWFAFLFYFFNDSFFLLFDVKGKTANAQQETSQVQLQFKIALLLASKRIGVSFK